MNRGLPREAVATIVSQPDMLRVRLERIHFSKHRPHQLHFVVQGCSGWQQDLFGEWIGIDAEHHAGRETEKLQRPDRGQLLSGDTSGIVSLPEWGIVLRRPGLDRKLHGLRLLRNYEEAAELLRRLEGTRKDVDSVDLVAHRLGKRAVLRVTLAGNEIRYIRLRATRNQSGLRSFHWHQKLYECLRQTRTLTIPEPLGFDDELGAAVFHQLPGGMASWSGPNGLGNAELTGQALYELQSLEPLSVKHHDVNRELEILRTLHIHLQRLLPELADRVAKHLDGVEQKLTNLGTYDPVMTHRDLHQKQILVSGCRVGILDFDTLSLAHPALDMGNLGAHFLLSEIRGEYPAGPLENALRKELPEISDREIAGWKAAALLRLAMIYSFTQEPLQIIHTLLEEVERCYLV